VSDFNGLDFFIGKDMLLDAVDFDTAVSDDEYSKGESINVCAFRMNTNVYMAMEDPNDGYRSSLGSVAELPNYFMKNVFHPVLVRGRYGSNNPTDYSDYSGVVEFVDLKTGEVVLEIGTDTSDDYYPSCVMSFHPENMWINKDKFINEENTQPDTNTEV
jgi:hypothetical protein